MDSTRKAIVFALAGWSGFFVMAVELLSGRVLAPSFGNSIYVWGAVITVFMLALAVGYLLGGHFSVFSPSLRRLGALLIAAGLATLPVVFFGDSALDWIFDRVNDPRYGSLLASSLLFFVPTAISGAVSPYAVRLLVSSLHGSGKIGRLALFRLDLRQRGGHDTHVVLPRAAVRSERDPARD